MTYFNDAHTQSIRGENVGFNIIRSFTLQVFQFFGPVQHTPNEFIVFNIGQIPLDVGLKLHTTVSSAEMLLYDF